jgi:hypothetical protein
MAKAGRNGHRAFRSKSGHAQAHALRAFHCNALPTKFTKMQGDKQVIDVVHPILVQYANGIK